MGYDAATRVTSQFIDLTTPVAPVGAVGFAGDPPQPTSLMLDTDGNLLVGLSPDDSDDGAVLKFNLQSGALMGTVAQGVGDPSGLAFSPVTPSEPRLQHILRLQRQQRLELQRHHATAGARRRGDGHGRSERGRRPGRGGPMAAIT